jgi:hypothetical protein
MNRFFSTLKVGDRIKGRESKGSPWETITVVEIDEDNITFEDPDGIEISSDRDEVNENVFFKATS